MEKLNYSLKEILDGDFDISDIMNENEWYEDSTGEYIALIFDAEDDAFLIKMVDEDLLLYEVYNCGYEFIMFSPEIHNEIMNLFNSYTD